MPRRPPPRCAGRRGSATAVSDAAKMKLTPGGAAALFALGTSSANATFHGPGARYAYAAPFVRFEADALWNEPAP